MSAFDPSKMLMPGSNLYAKLRRAAKSIGPIAKAGRNTEEGYSFVEAAPVIAAARAALHARGLIIVPISSTANAEPIMDGRYARLTSVTVRYAVIDTVSGEHFNIEWSGQGMDAGDKGASKGYTSALKYLLINLLMIPIGDDPEGDESTDRVVKRRHQKTEEEIKAAVERASEDGGMAPGRVPFDAMQNAMELYGLRCRRMGWAGRGSSQKRRELIFEVLGQMKLRKDLTLADYQTLNAALAERLEVKAGAQRTDSPGESATRAVEPAPVGPVPNWIAAVEASNAEDEFIESAPVDVIEQTEIAIEEGILDASETSGNAVDEETTNTSADEDTKEYEWPT